jgi:hypothetical protein
MAIPNPFKKATGNFILPALALFATTFTPATQAGPKKATTLHGA